MNLTSEPWIPALGADGQRELYSLRSLFAQAHELRDLAVKPHERIALMRLLLCITQVALDGPADESDWESCEPLIQPKVESYLKQWKASFELFGDGLRFLQLPNLKPGKETDEGNAATKLDLALATGNNSTLFDNHAGADRILESGRAALNLVAFQCFAPGGRIGVARWNGQETGGKGSSNHAPCTPSSMVHAFILGQNLLATLRANLLTREQCGDAHGPDRWGKPVWEWVVEKATDSTAIENATRTYLGRLAPVSRAIRLNDDGYSIILANGLDYPIFPTFREPTATVIKRKDELAVLPASTSRSLWRQLGAVSVTQRVAADGACGPLALNHANASPETTLWVGSLVTDKAKIEDVVESTYSLPAGMFTAFGCAAYQRGVTHAEEREGMLIQAVKAYAVALKIADPAYDRARQRFYDRAGQRFWTRIEQELSSLFDLARNTDLVLNLPDSKWGKAVQDATRAAYEQSCPRQTPRQIQAYALGLRKLSFVPKPSKPSPNSP